MGGGGQRPQRRGCSPFHDGHVGDAQVAFVLLDESTGLRLALDGVDLAVLGDFGHLQGHGARSGPHVPADGVLRQAKLGEGHRPDLGLRHGHLGPEEIPVGSAGGADGVSGAGILHQHQGKRRKGPFRQVSGGAPGDPLLGVGQIFAYDHRKMAQAVLAQGQKHVGHAPFSPHQQDGLGRVADLGNIVAGPAVDGQQPGIVPAHPRFGGEAGNGGHGGQHGGLHVLDQGQKALGAAIEARVAGHGHHHALAGRGAQNGFDLPGRHGVLYRLSEAGEGVRDPPGAYDQVRLPAGLFRGQRQAVHVSRADAQDGDALFSVSRPAATLAKELQTVLHTDPLLLQGTANDQGRHAAGPGGPQLFPEAAGGAGVLGDQIPDVQSP